MQIETQPLQPVGNLSTGRKNKSTLSLFNALSYHTWTAFLFTKSDIKTMLLPILAHAAASAPFKSYNRILPTAFWIWIQVLVNSLANQTISPDEDEVNKKYRPIPSKRITLQMTVILRWIIPVLDLIYSTMYSKQVFNVALGYCTVIWAYNDLGLSSGHWAGRNVFIGLGMAMIEAGACLLAGHTFRNLDRICELSIICSGFICATTYQAGDFKDIEGDRLVGRKTLPIVYPRSARPIQMLTMVAWSVGLGFLWDLDPALHISFVLLAAFTGWRFITKTSRKDDLESCYWYYVWLSVAHVLPAYLRFVSTGKGIVFGHSFY